MPSETLLHLESNDTFEEGADFELAGDGIVVSVSEEKAVDSYNQSFTCSLTMNRAQAVQLRDWLNRHFPA